MVLIFAMSFLKRPFYCAPLKKCLIMYAVNWKRCIIFFSFSKQTTFLNWILYVTWHAAMNRIVFIVLIFENSRPFVEKKQTNKQSVTLQPLRTLFMIAKKYSNNNKTKIIIILSKNVFNVRNVCYIMCIRSFESLHHFS